MESSCNAPKTRLRAGFACVTLQGGAVFARPLSPGNLIAGTPSGLHILRRYPE